MKIHDVKEVAGATVITNPSREILYLAAAKQAVKAESIGMRLTRGPKVTPSILKRFGLKRGTPTVDVLARIDLELEKVRGEIAIFNAGGNEVRA